MKNRSAILMLAFLTLSFAATAQSYGDYGTNTVYANEYGQSFGTAQITTDNYGNITTSYTNSYGMSTSSPDIYSTYNPNLNTIPDPTSSNFSLFSYPDIPGSLSPFSTSPAYGGADFLSTYNSLFGYNTIVSPSSGSASALTPNTGTTSSTSTSTFIYSSSDK